MELREKLEEFKSLEGLQKNVFFLGVTLFLAGLTMGAGNLITSDEPVKVGNVEVYSECMGIDAGVCLGFQHRTHETFNYVNWSDAEPGTENFYRRVESELMAKAYNVCDSGMNGMEWTSKVSYRNKTAEEWMQNENVTLLPCEDTFYRPLE
ncbi:MAG: hypothetical protein ABEJ93_04625 [Candidatus Nanohalobium sp.]